MTGPAAPRSISWTGWPRPTRREVLTGSLLLCVAAGSVLLKPRRMFARLSQDELSERLYDQVLTRVYVASGRVPIMALFAYGSVQNLSLELHRPDECYPQQGFTITEPELLPMTMGRRMMPAEVLTARRANGYVEQVVFWSRIGAHFPPNRTAQSLLVARENFAGRMPDGLLARLSVPTADRPMAVAAVEGFLRDLDHALSPLGRRIVLGEAMQEPMPT